jgi:amino acid permease
MSNEKIITSFSSSDETILSSTVESTSNLLKVSNNIVEPEETQSKENLLLAEDLEKSLKKTESADSFSSEPEKMPRGTFASSSINLLNTILGAALLNLPKAISSVGYVPGTLIIIATGFASSFGLHLLAFAAKKVGRESSFFSISKITYPNLTFLFDLAIAIKCFGVATTYLTVVKDLMPKIFAIFVKDMAKYPFASDSFFWIGTFLVIITPLTFLKRIDSLKYASFTSLIAMFYLVAMIVAYYSAGFRGKGFVDPVAIVSPTSESLMRFLESFSTFVFAFTCHQNILSIHNEKKNNSLHSLDQVIGFAISTSTIVYIIGGNLGYMTFGPLVNPNLLKAYPNDIAVTVARFAYVMLTILSYPLQAHPCRASIDKLISWKRRPEYANKRHYIISTCILFLTYMFAAKVDSIQTVLSVVGSTASPTICYILPAIFYYKLTINQPWTSKRISAIALGFFGFLVMAVCLPVTIYKISSN